MPARPITAAVPAQRQGIASAPPLGPRSWPARATTVVVAPADLIVYDDSGSGTVTVSGSATEAAARSRSGSGTITVAGTVPSESLVHSGASDFQDASSIEFALSGTTTQSMVYADSMSGAIRLLSATLGAYPSVFFPGQVYPSQTAAVTTSRTHSASQSGTVTLSGTFVEDYAFAAEPPDLTAAPVDAPELTDADETINALAPSSVTATTLAPAVRGRGTLTPAPIDAPELDP